MECAEKRQLVDDYVERSQALSVEVELLLHAVDGRSSDDERACWARVEEARLRCEIAHLALLNHLTNHACDGSASTH